MLHNMKNKIVVRVEFPVLPGKLEQCRSAALALREQVQREDKGATLYEFFFDESKKNMVVTEGYVDEAALMWHATSGTFDFTKLIGSWDLAKGKVDFFGNPSDTLIKTFKDALGGVPVVVYQSV